MIYIMGDTHGERDRFETLVTADGQSPAAGDYLLICGDFGFIFANSEEEAAFLDELEKKPYTVCFCDGNHENFPAVYAYPKEKWQGGRVHRIRKNVLHLMRGEVFNIDGKSFFVMGGAYSRDKHMRYENLSWWPQELPHDGEYRNAEQNLRYCEYRVDYVLTHNASRKTIRAMGTFPDTHDNELTGFFDWLEEALSFRAWFFGHWHRDRWVDAKHRVTYRELIALP